MVVAGMFVPYGSMFPSWIRDTSRVKVVEAAIVERRHKVPGTLAKSKRCFETRNALMIEAVHDELDSFATVAALDGARRAKDAPSLGPS